MKQMAERRLQDRKNKKRTMLARSMTLFLVVMLMMMPLSLTAFAKKTTSTLTEESTEAVLQGEDMEDGSITTNWDMVYGPLIQEVKDDVIPFTAFITTIGALYAIFLGVKFAKAEDPQEHEKAKKAIVTLVIGYITVYVLLFALYEFLPMFAQWLYVSMGVGRN